MGSNYANAASRLIRDPFLGRSSCILQCGAVLSDFPFARINLLGDEML